MKRVLAIVLSFFFLGVPPVFSAQPSFDCSKSEHDVEDLICEDDELAGLDQSLSGLYGALLKSLPAGEQKNLKAEQRGWIKGRNECWKADNMRNCVQAEYEARINELKDR